MKFTPRRVLCYAICFVVVRLVVYDLSLEDDEGYYGIPATVDEDGFPAFVGKSLRIWMYTKFERFDS